jgi:ABC-type polysaccharide/polyol phosphate export permease
VAWANQVNPVTPVLVSSRQWLLGTEWSDPIGFGVVVGVSAILLVVAWLVWRFGMTFVVERAGS